MTRSTQLVVFLKVDYQCNIYNKHCTEGSSVTQVVIQQFKINSLFWGLFDTIRIVPII